MTIRLGLCCKFHKEPIRFKISTAAYLKQFSRPEQLNRLSLLCLENARSLLTAIEYCRLNHIGCFRVNSQILPLKTHPAIKYEINDLPNAKEIKKIFDQCRREAKRHNIRLSFHPDQFILLSSPDAKVLRNSIAELNYQAEVSELIGADVINIHAGGAYNDKPAALKRLAKRLSMLKKNVRKRLTIENDDRLYTPVDLLPFCKKHGIPMVYDIHHHRCLPDGLSIKKVTDLALATWDREPLFHVSSPKYGWDKSRARWHHDYINIKDFPKEWLGLNITVEVEAKAKELAVKKLYHQLKLSS